MPQSFHCPTCNAPLSYQRGDPEVIRCEYCNSSVIVPENLRQKEEKPPVLQSIQIDMGNYGTKTASRTGGCLTGIIILITVVVIIGVAMISTGVFAVGQITNGDNISFLPPSTPRSSTTPRPTQTPASTNTPVPTATPPFAQELLRFGGEGFSPGRFDDARSITADAGGQIYVADYQGGRIQVFDGEGAFIRQIQADMELIILALAADRDGVFYTVQGGQIHKFDGATGEKLAMFNHPTPGLYYHDVVLTPTGELLALVSDWSGSVFATSRRYYDISWLDENGNVLRNRLLDDVNVNLGQSRLFVDGAGMIYLPGNETIRNDQHIVIYRFDSQGNLLNFIDGGARDAESAGSFDAVNSLVVDSWGRMYIATNDDIMLLDEGGRYVDTIAVDRSIFDLSFLTDTELLALDREFVHKLAIPEPE